jgi:hypothetical protein
MKKISFGSLVPLVAGLALTVVVSLPLPALCCCPGPGAEHPGPSHTPMPSPVKPPPLPPTFQPTRPDLIANRWGQIYADVPPQGGAGAPVAAQAAAGPAPVTYGATAIGRNFGEINKKFKDIWERYGRLFRDKLKHTDKWERWKVWREWEKELEGLDGAIRQEKRTALMAETNDNLIYLTFLKCPWFKKIWDRYKRERERLKQRKETFKTSKLFPDEEQRKDNLAQIDKLQGENRHRLINEIVDADQGDPLIERFKDDDEARRRYEAYRQRRQSIEEDFESEMDMVADPETGKVDDRTRARKEAERANSHFRNDSDFFEWLDEHNKGK